MPTGVDSSSSESRRPTSSSARRKGARLATAVALTVIVADQLSKWWAVSNLADNPLTLVGSYISFELSRNSGSALSLFQGFTPILAILAVILTVVLVRVIQRSEDLLSIFGLALILGGAVGNLIDRIFRAPGIFEGSVVDFIRVGSFPIFNIADSAITVGAVVVVVASFTHGGRRGAPKQV